MEFCEWGILGRSPGPPNGNWYPKWLPRRLEPPPLLFSQLVSAGSKGGQRGAAAVLAVPSPGQAVSSAPRPLAALGTCLGGSGRAPSGGDAASSSSSSSCSLPLPRWFRRRWRRAPGVGARGGGRGNLEDVGGRGRLGGGVGAKRAYLPAGS